MQEARAGNRVEPEVLLAKLPSMASGEDKEGSCGTNCSHYSFMPDRSNLGMEKFILDYSFSTHSSAIVVGKEHGSCSCSACGAGSFAE